MTDVTITVRGSAERRARPERATVSLVAESEGPTPDHAFTAASLNAATLSGQLSQLESEGAITEWSSDQLRTWSSRPWEQLGRQGEPVHHARADVRATFGDLERMSLWLSAVAALDGVGVAGIEWSLTGAMRDAVTEEAREAAIADAVAKATAYATSLGLDAIEPVAVADAGMLDGSGHGPAPMALAASSRAMGAESAGGAMQLAPGEIAVVATVDARFLAR